MDRELTAPDVLQPRPAVLRLLRQRLREQVAHLARRGLRHATRRQAHEGLAAPWRPLPGAERCHGTGWSARPISCEKRLQPVYIRRRRDGLRAVTRRSFQLNELRNIGAPSRSIACNLSSIGIRIRLIWGACKISSQQACFV